LYRDSILPVFGSMSARVDIVIPTYNGYKHVDHCLTALKQQTYLDYRVIVVDDASTDGTPQRLRDAWPEVEQLSMPRNVGLVTAVNAALACGSSEYVALLNNDTEPEPGWLAALVDALERHPDAAAVASKLLLFDRRDHFHAAGDTYSHSGLPGNRGVWKRDTGQFEREEEVFGACAGAALYRRAALEAVARIDGAVLDPTFFMYCEDVDLSWRLRLLGYAIIYAPDAVVYHRLSATGGGPLASYFVARNTVNVMLKDLPGRLLWRNMPNIIGYQTRDVWRTLPHLRESAARARIRGLFAAVRTAPVMLAKRRRIQRSRTVSLEDIERLLLP
jgi:GT2 family glycosyltransferase